MKKGEGKDIVHWGANMIDGFLEGVESESNRAGKVMNDIVASMNQKPSSLVDRINDSVNMQLTTQVDSTGVNAHERYPAQINLTIAGRDFEAFVEDITESQERTTRVERAFS